MIAKISTGGGARGVLSYVLSNKRELEQKLEGERVTEQRQERTVEQAKTLDGGRAAARNERVKEYGREGDGAPKREHGTGGEERERGGTKRGLAAERDDAQAYRDGERARIIGGNMSGGNERELAREFGDFRALRPDVKNAVHHASISAGEGERLTAEQWRGIAGDYIRGMGYGRSAFVVIQHRDEPNDHIHIIASNITVDGQVVPQYRNYQRAEQIMREVEQKHELKRVPLSHEVARRAPTRGELEEFARTGQRSTKMRLQDTIDRALRDEPNTIEFINRMERAGVRINPNLQSTGRVSGISFEHGGEVMKGSNLGRGYSWQGLQKRGLEYEPERDLVALKEAKMKYLEAELIRQQEQAEQLAREASPMRMLEGMNPANAIKAQLEKYTSIEKLARSLNPINSITHHPIVQAVRAAKEFSERREEAAQARELVGETEREISELRESLSIRPAPAQEQEREQGRDLSWGLGRESDAQEQIIDSPAREFNQEIYPTAPEQNPIAEMYQAAELDRQAALGGEQGGRGALHNLNNPDYTVRGREALARAAGYDPNRSAEELLRDAMQPAYDRAEEREQEAATLDRQQALEETPGGRGIDDQEREPGAREEVERERGAELARAPEKETAKEIVEEMEQQIERSIIWEISL